VLQIIFRDTKSLSVSNLQCFKHSRGQTEKLPFVTLETRIYTYRAVTSSRAHKRDGSNQNTSERVCKWGGWNVFYPPEHASICLHTPKRWGNRVLGVTHSVSPEHSAMNSVLHHCTRPCLAVVPEKNDTVVLSIQSTTIPTFISVCPTNYRLCDSISIDLWLSIFLSLHSFMQLTVCIFIFLSFHPSIC
jgi:hypothetical protein